MAMGLGMTMRGRPRTIFGIMPVIKDQITSLRRHNA